jgi:hypothetical protein
MIASRSCQDARPPFWAGQDARDAARQPVSLSIQPIAINRARAQDRGPGPRDNIASAQPSRCASHGQHAIRLPEANRRNRLRGHFRGGGRKVPENTAGIFDCYYLRQTSQICAAWEAHLRRYQPKHRPRCLKRCGQLEPEAGASVGDGCAINLRKNMAERPANEESRRFSVSES